MNIDTRNNILSAVLGIAILVLSYFLYDAIVTPYEAVQQRKEVTNQVRTRMLKVRDALIQYELKTDKFPSELDTLITYLKTDSLIAARGDSMFKSYFESRYLPDSLIYSPRTGNRFTYVLVDTIRPNIYMLSDPDSKDRIGDTTRTTLLNAASWE